MPSLREYIDGVLDREKGFVDHPADRGGATNWGITEKVARAFGYHGRMQDMPQSVARQIYEERYWYQPRFDQVNEHSGPVAEKLLDVGVNMGTAQAAQFFQRALNAFNQEGKTYPDVAVDGAIGRMTVAAFRAYLAYRGKDGVVVMLRAINAQQGARYLDIAQANESQEAFTFGWFLHRVQ